jgi:hypothetical protein
MRINRSEAIALLESNASWSTIVQCFPDEAAAARFASVYFSKATSQALVAKSGETASYRVTWKRAFPKKGGPVHERLINLMMRRMEFEEITFYTHHAPDRSMGRSIGRTLLFASILRTLQMLIALIFSLGLLGVISGYLALASTEPLSGEELPLVLIPIYICVTILTVGIGMGLLARKLTHDIPFGNMARCGFAPVKIERLQNA